MFGKIIFNGEEILLIKYLYQAIAASNLDIYFILRINKHINSRNRKLVVGYFGQSHSSAISKYFSKIVKTHELVYTFENIQQNAEKNLKLIYSAKVNIPNSIIIDLNAEFNHTPPILSASQQALILHPSAERRMVDSPLGSPLEYSPILEEPTNTPITPRTPITRRLTQRMISMPYTPNHIKSIPKYKTPKNFTKKNRNIIQQPVKNR